MSTSRQPTAKDNLRTCVHSIAVGDDYRKLSNLTFNRMSDWCGNFGMEFSPVFEPVDSSVNPSWNKVLIMLGSMKNDLVPTRHIWLDADVLIIDQNRHPDSVFSRHRMSVSSDNNGPCMGVFSLPCSDWSIDMMSAIWFCGQIGDHSPYDSRDTWEQNTFKALFKNFKNINDNVMVLNERTTIANP